MKEIFTRASIRQFTNQPVEEEKVQKLLEAALAAPTSTNQRAWEFYVVTNPETLEKLAATTPYATPAKNAPMAIVIGYRTDCRLPEYGDIDCAIASENIWLEAEYLGLGTVMLGIAPFKEREDAVREVINAPENIVPFTIMPIGYPASKKEQTNRFESEKVHYL